MLALILAAVEEYFPEAAVQYARMALWARRARKLYRGGRHVAYWASLGGIDDVDEHRDERQDPVLGTEDPDELEDEDVDPALTNDL